LGEIGMNCLALESGEDIVLVDCGVMFPREGLGVEIVLPDLTWVRQRRERVRAVFLTHGHEDHLGALPWLLRQVPVPVFGTKLTLAIAGSRLTEAGVEANLQEVRAGDLRPGGAFSAEFIAVTHSVPDGCAIALSTPQGLFLHSGDFKIDPDPIDGRAMDLPRIEALGRAGIRFLFSDSTNAEHDGTTPGERTVGPALRAAFQGATGRVVVSCFASNLHRVQQVVEAAAATGRRVVALGRSMEHTMRLGRDLGYLQIPAWQWVETAAAATLPPRELAVLAAGSQGEPRGALGRLSRNDHPDLQVGPGDLVIFSARAIPGSEVAIAQVMDGFARLGAVVAADPALHVSGHAQGAEQERLISLARPERFVPIHGEYRHLLRHAARAGTAGVADDRRHLITDGQVLEIDDAGARLLPDRVAYTGVSVNREGEELVEAVLRDRRRLAEGGVVMAVVIVDGRTGQVVKGPDLHARGVAGFEDAVEALRGEVARAMEEAGTQPDTDAIREVLRLAVRRAVRREDLRRPAVVPVVLSI
jgi:ribonuclease J